MKIIIIINILLALITGCIYLSIDSKIHQASTQLVQQEFKKRGSELDDIIQLNKKNTENLLTTTEESKLIASNINSIENKLKDSSNYITVDSGSFIIDKNTYPELISDGSCNKKRGIFDQLVTFKSNFKQPPKVLLTISGLDVWANKDTRFKTEVINTTKDGFQFNAYTWCDTSVSFAKLSWISIGI